MVTKQEHEAGLHLTVSFVYKNVENNYLFITMVTKQENEAGLHLAVSYVYKKEKLYFALLPWSPNKEIYIIYQYQKFVLKTPEICLEVQVT